MKMVFRWFGEGNDSIPLSHVNQIPGVEGIVWALHDLAAGEVWSLDRIKEVKVQADAAGLHMDVVESVNVHDDIKLGRPSRDHYIDNYIETIKNLATVGVKVIRSEEHTSELQSRGHLVCRLLLERKNQLEHTIRATV